LATYKGTIVFITAKNAISKSMAYNCRAYQQLIGI